MHVKVKEIYTTPLNGQAARCITYKEITFKQVLQAPITRERLKYFHPIVADAKKRYNTGNLANIAIDYGIYERIGLLE